MSTVWQTFRGGPARSMPNAVTVSINEHSVINLSRAAAKLLGNPEHVLLHYDERNSVIGITAAEAGTPGAFRLKARPRDCGRAASVTAFCRHFRIRIEGTERFDNPHLDQNNILLLDLKQTHRVAQQNPRRKKGTVERVDKTAIQ